LHRFCGVKISLLILFIFYSFASLAREGFYDVAADSTFQNLTSAVVKISVPKKINFSTIVSRPTYIEDGFFIQTWPVEGGPLEINSSNCSKKEMLFFNYFADACLALKLEGILKGPVKVKFSGSGYFVNQDGTIVTAKHVVDDACKFYFKGKFPFHCPHLQFEVMGSDGRLSLVRGGSITAWSEKIGADSALDYAIVKIDHKPRRILRFCNEAPILGEKIAAVGFPIITGRNTSKRYSNADGSQRISYGNIVAPTSKNFEREKRDSSDIRQEFIFADVDIVGGNSGGPMLSQSGCAYGTATRISKMGLPNAPNVNTEYLVSTDNAVWFSSNASICRDLSQSGVQLEVCLRSHRHSQSLQNNQIAR
jgi:S1-C subfamily serine protease